MRDTTANALGSEALRSALAELPGTFFLAGEELMPAKQHSDVLLLNDFKLAEPSGKGTA